MRSDGAPSTTVGGDSGRWDHPEKDIIELAPCDLLRMRTESTKDGFIGVVSSSSADVGVVDVHVVCEDMLGRDGVYAVSEGGTDTCEADGKCPSTLGRSFDGPVKCGGGLGTSTTDALAERLCVSRDAVLGPRTDAPLPLARRGKRDRREGVEGGLVPGADECEERKEKWKLRNEEVGEWRSFELRERWVFGVGGASQSEETRRDASSLTMSSSSTMS